MDTMKCITGTTQPQSKNSEILITILQIPLHKINHTQTTRIRLLHAVHYHS